MKMTKKQNAYRLKLLRLCHTLKRNHELFCEEEARRDWIEERYGTRSFANLTITELREVADYLRGQAPTRGSLTRNQQYYIRSQWQRHAQDKTERALLKFVTRTTGLTYMRVEMLSKAHASMVITGLNRWFAVE